MARPPAYRLKDGTRVPSVTTILSRFKESGGLIHWAWDLGIQGKDYRDVRDDAASAGTMAHAAVDAWIHGSEYEFVGEENIVNRAKKAFEAFLKWAEQTQLTVTETECSLVSESYKYGGTPDAFTIQGKRACLDWKSSGQIYAEYLVQVAAYGNLWDEHHPDDPIKAGFHIVRFDKRFGDFHHHFYGELNAAWEAFKLLRRLYELDQELKARAK